MQLEAVFRHTQANGPFVTQLSSVAADFGQVFYSFKQLCLLLYFSPWTRCYIEVSMLEQEP